MEYNGCNGKTSEAKGLKTKMSTKTSKVKDLDKWWDFKSQH